MGGGAGGGSGRTTKKLPGPKDCVNQPWLAPVFYCWRCKEKAWASECKSKWGWEAMGAEDRKKYRRGTICVEVEVTGPRKSAEVASEAITKQLENEKADNPAPVKRQTPKELHGEQHGRRTGSAGLTSPRRVGQST